MNYHDYIDWDKIHALAYEKAFDLAFTLLFEDKLKEDEIGYFVKLAHMRFCEEIYMMGPTPMKEGWNPPTFEMPFL